MHFFDKNALLTVHFLLLSDSFRGGATAVANFCNKLANKNKRGMTLAYSMLIGCLSYAD